MREPLKTGAAEVLRRAGALEGLRLLRARVLRRPRLVVLCWHRVAEDAARIGGTAVTPGELDAMAAYCVRRFDVWPLQRVASWLRGGPGPSRDTVSFTFDDGALEHHTVVAPILERRGVPATFFVCTRPPAAGDGRLDAGAIADLARRGFEIGGHTRTHPVLARITAEACREEIRGGLDDLARCGVAVRSFAYPYGDRGTIGDAAEGILADAGVAIAVTTEERAVARLDPVLRVPRKVVSRQSIARVAARLERLSWSG